MNSVKIYQQLQQTDFDTYAPLVADIFHQIAIICFNLRELQDAIGAILKSKDLYARLIENNPRFKAHYSHIHLAGATFYLEMDHAKGALNLFDVAAQNFVYLSQTETDKVNMAWGCQDIYEYHAIRAIQGMGKALVRMKEYPAAHEKLELAINYFRHIVQGDSELCTPTFVAICTPHLAECLSLRALAYNNSNRLLEAESVFAKTLSMYRHLNNQHPGIYTNSLVEALKLRGKVLGRLNKMEEAHACFDQAIELIEPAKQYWFIKADIYLEMGYLAYSQMHDNKSAYEHFSKCIEIYEDGVREIDGQTHRDILKTKIESAYYFLIDHYAQLFAKQEDTSTFSTLVNLCEALRQRETLSDIGMSQYHDEKDLHTVAKRITQDYTTSLIIVTLTIEQVHFIIIGQDGFKVRSQNKDWFHRFTELQHHFQKSDKSC